MNLSGVVTRVRPRPTHESRIWPLQSAKRDGTEAFMATAMVVKATGGGDGVVVVDVSTPLTRGLAFEIADC